MTEENSYKAPDAEPSFGVRPLTSVPGGSRRARSEGLSVRRGLRILLGAALMMGAAAWAVQAVTAGVLVGPYTRSVRIGMTVTWLATCVGLGGIGFALIKGRRTMGLVALALMLVFGVATGYLNTVAVHQRLERLAKMESLLKALQNVHPKPSADPSR